MNYSRKIFCNVILSIIAFLVSGYALMNHKTIQLTKEMEELHRKGITTRMLGDSAVEIEEQWSGFKRIKTLNEPSGKTIQEWITKHNVPLLEIDPSLIDTNTYAGWFTYWTTVPVSNGIGGPLLVGDLNKNGKPEIYGNFKDYLTDFMTKIFEVRSNGTDTVLYNYVPRRGSSMQFVDSDNDGLKEVIFNYGDSCFNYEQSTLTSLPTRRNFNYGMWKSQGTGIWTFYKMTHLDGDSLMDFVYRGSEPDDSLIPSQDYTYVAEFNPSINNFEPVWKTQLWSPNSESGIEGYVVGDFDRDEKMEFLASGLNGQIWVVENNGNNSYNVSWVDTLPFVNLYYQTSGDVDNDGKREFFVGATTGSGNWTTVFEADSDNHYSPIFVIRLLSGGSLDEPTNLTADVDNDGKPELVIFSGSNLFIFKSNGNNSYYLWYYKHENAKDGIQFYDFDGDGRKDFIISKSYQDSLHRGKFYADIYKANPSVGVHEGGGPLPAEMELLQNYPNPFNPVTQIKYQLSQNSFVTLKVYDMLGREAVTLANEEQSAGYKSVEFNAAKFPSGVYIYKLTAGSFVETKKMLLLK